VGDEHKKQKHSRGYYGPMPNDADFKYETMPIQVKKKKTVVEILQETPSYEDMKIITEKVMDLSMVLDVVRRGNFNIEPFHVQFVGRPRQGKTQTALKLVGLLKRNGMITVARSAEDIYFDDLQKALQQAVYEKTEEGRYVYHPEKLDKRMPELKVDVLMMDELYSRRIDPPDVVTILNGITPMPWKPLMADPKNKGFEHKPMVWLTTANHEITDHGYNVMALLRRVHRRIVVDGGRLYDQKCFRFAEPIGSYRGGFETCQGRFGVWKRGVETRGSTVGSSYDSRANVSVSAAQTVTVSSQVWNDVYDTSDAYEFTCKHCERLSYADLVTIIVDGTIQKIKNGIML